MRNTFGRINKNTPVLRRIRPHNECVGECYFIVILNCQFTENTANTRLGGQAFFDRLP